MPLEPGSVTAIAEDRTVTGTGLAEAIAEAWLTLYPGGGLLTGEVGASIRRGTMQVANALGPAIINYLLANAVVTVTVHPADAGLQRTPNPNNPNTATLGPAADVSLTGGIT